MRPLIPTQGCPFWKITYSLGFIMKLSWPPTVVDHLAFAVGRSALHAEVWLMQAPKDVRQCVWDVVVLVVVRTMESGHDLCMATAL